MFKKKEEVERRRMKNEKTPLERQNRATDWLSIDNNNMGKIGVF